ncbi:MTH938/NDUFAF3 family protein [Sphingomonas sp. 1P06PA]|uniref:Mth938-like domain-containing protein n=1 Tax=Sphingomonas sp. 1P06PA TaxID=554121 RepID=UPI0039A72F6E
MPPRFEREGIASGPVVRGFSGTGFRIDDRVHDGGVLLTPLWARAWTADSLDTIDPDSLVPLTGIDPAPEFILLGTGPTLRRPPQALIDMFDARGIGIEPMDSRAAARAWTILRGEDRWIAAGLLPLG